MKAQLSWWDIYLIMSTCMALGIVGLGLLAYTVARCIVRWPYQSLVFYYFIRRVAVGLLIGYVAGRITLWLIS